jgi:hypothetical protein
VIWLVLVQAATFVGLGVWMMADGDWKRGLAQLLLAGITWLIYG